MEATHVHQAVEVREPRDLIATREIYEAWQAGLNWRYRLDRAIREGDLTPEARVAWIEFVQARSKRP